MKAQEPAVNVWWVGTLDPDLRVLRDKKLEKSYAKMVFCIGALVTTYCLLTFVS